jgi:hypothetical protein
MIVTYVMKFNYNHVIEVAKKLCTVPPGVAQPIFLLKNKLKKKVFFKKEVNKRFFFLKTKENF